MRQEKNDGGDGDEERDVEQETRSFHAQLPREVWLKVPANDEKKTNTREGNDEATERQP